MAVALDNHIYCSPFSGVLSLDRLGETRGPDGGIFEVPDPAPEVPDILDQKRVCDLLHKAINSLPERQQEVILTLFFRERSVVQTARTLSISPAAVVKLRAKAVKRLRSEIGPQYSGLFD